MISGVPSFELLQRRITVARRELPSRTLARNIPVVFFAFDLLYLDGHDLARRRRSSNASAC